VAFLWFLLWFWSVSRSTPLFQLQKPVADSGKMNYRVPACMLYMFQRMLLASVTAIWKPFVFFSHSNWKNLPFFLLRSFSPSFNSFVTHERVQWSHLWSLQN
jgi:hypothetical protein